MNTDEMEAGRESEIRKRKMTEKGQRYNLELKQKQFDSIFKGLCHKSDELNKLMASNADVSEVRHRYKDWLDDYELFFKLFDDICSLMSPEEKGIFMSVEYSDKDEYLRNIKSSVENWFSSMLPREHYKVGDSNVIETTDSVQAARPRQFESSRHGSSSHGSSHHGSSRHGSSRHGSSLHGSSHHGSSRHGSSRHGSSRHGSSHSSLRSSISEGLLLEGQKRAELEATAGLLNKKQELDFEQFKLEQKKEELSLHKRLAISDAKRKVLVKFEEEHGGNVDVTQRQQVRVKSGAEVVPAVCDITETKASGLNPKVEPFVPIAYGYDIVANQNVHENISGEYSAVRHNVVSSVDNASHRFNAVTRDEHNSYASVSEFLHAPNKTTSDDILLSLVRHLNKPPPELKKFNGDPLEFKKFLRQFHSKVVVNTESDSDRMMYLEQFTTGEPNRIVSGYSYIDAKQGYRAAMKEIQQRYGDNDVLAAAFVKRALNWPIIKPDNPKALDDFGIFLSECGHAVQCIQAVKVLEYPDNLKKLVGKLPYYYHDKWRNIIQRKRENVEEIKFAQLVEFVKAEARKANDPIYGREALRPEQKNIPGKSSRITTKPAVSFVTKVTDSTPLTSNADSQTSKAYSTNEQTSEDQKISAFHKPCMFCSQASHALDVCQKIFDLPYQERIDFLKLKGLCYGCLRIGHQRKYCRNKATCKHCKGRHPSICHVEGRPSQISTTRGYYKSENRDEKPTTSASVNVAKERVQSSSSTDVDCTMAIIPVTVKMKNGMKVIRTYAFMDPGSTATFCTEKLYHELGCTGKPMEITLDTMGQRHKMKTFAVSGIEVGDLDLQNMIELPKVFTKDKMPVSTAHIPRSEDVNHWSHLNNIHLPEISEDVGLLIGNNVPDAYSRIEVRTGTRGSPHATRSLLGWILWNVMREDSTSDGNVNHISVNHAAVVAIEEIEILKQLQRKIQQSIRLDFPEHAIDDRKEPSQEDIKFRDKVNNSIKLEDGQYCISLPFKSNHVKFPNNAAQARQRLKGLKSKMNSNNSYKENYTTFMEKIIEKGYAEPVPENELHRDDGKVWYIPHHGVYHPRKPNKIRVVFDCSATYAGACLNTALLQGPDLTNNLLAVLLRFRQERVAIVGDVESMFYKVNVPKEDSDCLRFLWWPDGNTEQAPQTYRMRVHLFGAVSSPSCANTALRKTSEDNGHKFGPEVADTVNRNFYVDDCLVSVDSEDKAIKLVKEVTCMCQLGGFRLTKWISSSREVIDSIPEDQRATEVQPLNLDCDHLPNERVLGVHWVTENDTLGFNIQPKDLPCTRRGILSIVSSVFDPLGLAAPFVLIGKIILQELCRADIGWDEKISGDNLKHWQQWLEQLPLLKNLKISRCYKPNIFGLIKTYQIHIFSDASEKGYGVAIYLRLTDDLLNTHVTLVMSKARVAPLKKISIPRMELTAATMAVRLSRMLIRELDYTIDSIRFWTDSMSVIRYINNETTRFHTFVANRIAMIRDGSDISQWQHVPSKLNAADLASRGSHMDKFLENETWFQGPCFLRLPEEEWPHLDISQKSLPEDDPEVKTTTIASTIEQPASPIDILINHCSDWIRLKKITGWVIVAVEKFKRLTSAKTPRDATPAREMTYRLKNTYLSVEKLRQAEDLLVKQVQRQHFMREIEIISGQDKNTVRNLAKTSPLRKLDPFMSAGFVRVGGRLSQADIPYDSRHPIVLPRSGLSRLFLEHVHRQIGHLGKRSILSNVRQKYWIIGAPTMIKKLVKNCIICRRYQAKVGEQKMADLPPERLQPDQPPFSTVGVDYFGPIEVKRGRTILKRYGVLFTCLTSRAVHLELACSLDTDSCICAIRRLISRRGPVKVMRSDNGTNLAGSERELREELQRWNQAKIHEALQQDNIKWIFNPPSGSHHGGIWERLIRIVRKVLYSLLRQQSRHLDDELLATLFCEVESIMNNRPIIEVSHDYRDLDALTPNHLLLMRSGENLPPGLFSKSDNYANRRWRQIQYLSEVFWRRWTLEYLPLLQERQKWLQPKRNLQKDDLVLVVDVTPRNSWCLGRIMETTKDRLGFVRSATVKTKSTTLIRPIDKLCLLLEADGVNSVKN